MCGTHCLSQMTLPADGQVTAAPLRRVGRAIREFFAPEAGKPNAPCHMGMKLRPAKGSNLEVEIADGTITIKGAIITIFDPDGLQISKSRKVYY
ncbi:hypothetical protein [Thalassobaculum sp.]|uniref:hypothetical protein n=1 Tax=Thalassobaculum sp. TaxID=2022740 RepID=UPI0032EDF32B